MSQTVKPPKDLKPEKPECFVIMPISDCDGYSKGHFQHVFDDIIDPACEKAGFAAIRADQVKQSNLIHLEILQSLLEAPMAVCDLSSRNPNVLFELALRQAFDKPVCLIQEVGTPPIFDISPFRYIEYRRERIYHEVLEDQNKISESIFATHSEHTKGKGINSIIKLLALSKPATLPEFSAPDASSEIQHLILAELNQLREEVRLGRRETVNQKRSKDESSTERTVLRDMLRQAEIHIVSAVSTDELKLGMMMLDQCRHHLAMLSCSSPEERASLLEHELNIEILQAKAQELTERMKRKQK
jgi:hypothetical protein